MRFYARLLLTLSLAVNVLGVFRDEAFLTDFHYALLGPPKQDSTFFHRPQTTSGASLLYTLSEKLLVGAINPKDGAIVWRHDLSTYSNKEGGEGFLRAKAGESVVVSGVGNRISAWDALDGRLVWDTQLEEGYTIKDLEVVDDASTAPSVVVLLGRGDRGVVKTLDAGTGAVRGEFADESGDTPFQVSSSSSGIQYVSAHSTMLKGLRLKVTSLDPNTKHQVSQYSLSSDSDISSTDSVIFVGYNTAAPLIVWADKGFKTLKINVIGSKSVQSINIDNNSGEDIYKVVVHAPQSPSAVPHFLVHYQTRSEDWAEVYHINLKSFAVSKAYSLPKLRGTGGTFSTSTIDANVYFTRITQSEVSLVSSASHGLLGRWEMALKYSEAAHAVSEVVARGKNEFAVRFGLIADGTLVLIRNGDVVWTRPEDLAGAVAAAWVDPEQGPSLKRELELESHGNIVSAYVHRVRRHAHDIQHLPEWVMGLPELVRSSFGDSKPSSTFGFNKIVLVGTESGRVMALDAADGGKILWNSPIVLRTSTVHIAAITVHGREATIYEDDGTTVKLGLTLESDGFKVQFLSVIEGLSVPHGYVTLPGSSHLVQIQSDGSPASAAAAKGGIVITQNWAKDASGWQIEQAIGWEMGATPSKVWEFQAPTGHRILSIVSRPPHDPVASAGKVLGDRSVMYKYLNPNLALITTATASSMTIHLLDSVSGRVLHSATHTGVDSTLPVPAVLSEHWFAYSFFADPKTASASKGHRLVISELYESPIANDRGPLGAASNFSTLDPSSVVTPHVLSQSYIIPSLISSMSVTQSRQGITVRQILCVLPTENAIIGIPRPWLDPRRPVDRDPTALEMEEGLFKYSPVLDFDGKWYITHVRDVRGIKEVVSTPSLLESTSLVFGFGGDVFGTRIAPSGSFDVLGREFSKIQLVLTVCALSIGVGILGPMVRKKQVDTRWKM